MGCSPLWSLQDELDATMTSQALAHEIGFMP
jgi:hypothetical protein